jgi:hypothetical protein
LSQKYFFSAIERSFLYLFKEYLNPWVFLIHIEVMRKVVDFFPTIVFNHSAVVKAEIPEFSFGQFIGNEEFVIGVQSKFLNEDAEANDKPIILQFAGNVKAGTVAEYGDTGVGQKAAIKKGVASLQEVEVPSPCRLMPYRTFTEVAQPMSNFIFRVKDNDRYGVTCALFEADGGAWKNEAKANIKAYLEKELADVSNIFVIS